MIVGEQETDPRHAGEEIERLLEDLKTVGDARVVDKAEQLVGTTVELYGATLKRILEVIFEAPEGERLIEGLAADELVSSMLILHDLHPYDLETRVEQALIKVRPYLGSHEGDVEFLGVTDEGVVRLRLKGSCDGCPSSTVTLRTAIERAIFEAAPEVIRVDAEGNEAEEVAPQPAGGLLQVGMGPPGNGAPTNGAPANGAPVGADAQWTKVEGVSDLSAGTVVVSELVGAPILFCRLSDNLYAYRDLCPSCGRNLRGGALEGDVLSCPSCGEAYDVRRAGRALDPARAGSLNLAPLPLLENGGDVEVALPGVSAH